MGNMDTGFLRMAIIAAHPDDELLFFYGLLQRMPVKELWLIIVTGEFDSGHQKRNVAARRSAEFLNSHYINCNFRDTRDAHLNVADLRDMFRAINLPKGIPIFTHGIVGEYGHPHHIDTFYAAVSVFHQDLFFISGPFRPNISIELDEKELRKKKEAVQMIYNDPKVANWSCGVERFSAFRSFKYKSLIIFYSGIDVSRSDSELDFNLCVEFLSKLETNLLRKNRMPPETRVIADNWKFRFVHKRISLEIARLRKLLLDKQSSMQRLGGWIWP